jgi:SAM-dependent methyltransferase
MTQYDKIANTYIEEKKHSIIRLYAIYPSIRSVLRNIRGENVLDIGCGDGYSSRYLASMGAKKIVGVDISKKMIEMAKKQELEQPIGISYYRYDAIKTPKLGEFDLVVGVNILHYSRTREQLLLMCKSAYSNLKTGGRFVSINNNPENPTMMNKKLGLSITVKQPLKEGCRLIVAMYKNEKKICSFYNYFWGKKTYEWAMKTAGFKNVKWHKVVISQEGAKLGKDLWGEYYNKPSHITIEGTK